jgi:uncharacterized protein YndB with AHSA1/START domain
MFRFEKTIIIERTPHQVFNYLANPANTPKWRDDVVETKFDSLPLKVGDRIQEVISFTGLQTNIVEVVEVARDHKLAYKVISGPLYLPFRSFLIAPYDNYTQLTIEVSVHTDGFTRLIEPISSGMFSIKWEDYLFKLKRVLEDTKTHTSV